MDTLGRDLQELMQFTEAVAATAHAASDHAQVFQALRDECAKSEKYAASVLLLTDDGSQLALAMTSHPPARLKQLERLTQAELYRIDLAGSRTCNAVAKRGQTLRVRACDLLAELFPSQLPDPLPDNLAYWQRHAVWTPLSRRAEIVGVFVLSSPDLPADSIPWVKNLAQHISGALELVEARAQCRRAENVLQQSEERYHALFERVPIGLYRTLPDGAILDANPAAVQMLGYPDSASLLAVNVLDLFVNPEDRRIERALAERDGIVRGFEMRLRRRDGSVIWVADTERAVRDSTGRVVQYEGSVEDITARRQSVERFRRMAEVIPVAFWMNSPDWKRMFYISRAAEDIYGRPAEDFYQRPLLWLEAVHPDDHERVHDFWTKHTGQHADLQYRIVRPDGQVRWIKDVGRPVRDRETGELLMLTGYMEDITAAVRAQETLQTSEENVRALLDSVYESIVLMDPAGTVLAGNQSFAEALGANLNDIVGLCIWDSFPADVAARRKAAVAQVVHTGKPNRFVDERQGRHFDNSIYPLLDAQGNVERVAVYARDVTERRRVEAQLAQSTRLASLGVLAGGIAHELRNPLAVISAGAQLLRDHLDDPRLCRQCVDIILTATERASQTIESVLRLAGPVNEVKTAVDIEWVLHKASALLQARMALQEITLRRKRQLGLPKAYGNAQLLQVVFFNLMYNACNAMPNGGTLTITTRTAEPGCICVRFRDTGHGIAPENLSKIFDPFFSTMPVGEGAGLGLSVSHRIIQQHQGTIQVRSQVGKGATFTVRLPMAADASAAPLQPSSDATSSQEVNSGAGPASRSGANHVPQSGANHALQSGANHAPQGGES